MKKWNNKYSFYLGVFIFGLIFLDYLDGSLYFSLVSALVAGASFAFFIDNIFANLYGRTIITCCRLFSVGDAIIISRLKIDGFVISVDLLTTRVLTPEKVPVIINNRVFINNIVEHVSRNSGRRIRAHCCIYVDLEDIPELKRTIQKSAMAMFELDEKYTIVTVTGCGLGYASFEVTFFIPTCSTNIVRDRQEAFLHSLTQLFAERGIEYVYPATIVTN